MGHFLAEVDLVRNPEPRCPCLLLLDTSGSMEEYGKIDAVNDGVHELIEDLKNESLAKKRVELCIVTFGGRAQVHQPFQTIMDCTFTPLQAYGRTPMGEAVLLGLRELEQRKAAYRQNNINYFRPIVYLITDGLATDVIGPAAAAVQKAEGEQGLSMYCVGTDDCDMEELAMISKRTLRLKERRFSELFQYISNSMKVMSQSQPGQKVQAPSGLDAWAMLDT